MIICLYHALTVEWLTCLSRAVLRLRSRISYENESKAACTLVHPKARDLYIPESPHRREKRKVGG